jgi:hypothetical protein
VPPVFANGRVLVYGFLDRPLEKEVEVRLEASGVEGVLSFPVRLSPSRMQSGSLVSTLAARALLRDLEEVPDKEAAIAASLKYGLSSKWASFVAVETRENAAPREIELRRVPVAITRGWGGLMSGTFVLSLGAGTDMDMDTGEMYRMPVPSDARSFLTAGIRRETSRGVDALVVLQRADGTWDLDDALASFLGKRPRQLKKKLEGATGDPEVAARAWATALALAWLERNAADSRAEWELLADKAKGWLSRCGATLSTGEEWLEAASRALTARGFWS